MSSRCFRISCDEGVDHCWPTSPRAVSVVTLERARRHRTGPCGSWSVFLLSSFQEASPHTRDMPEIGAQETWLVSARTLRRRGFGSLGQAASRVKSFDKKNSALGKVENSWSQVVFRAGSENAASPTGSRRNARG